jgi:predicted O-methyltransferase YrrM
MMSLSAPRLDTRRVGEYGHYVAALPQLVEDVCTFLSVDARQYIDELSSIDREGQGVHPEEAAMLYLLVRALQPQSVLETGTYKGYSTSEIARAIKLNGSGHLVTVDIAADTGSAVPQELITYISFERERPSRLYAEKLKSENRKIDFFFHDSLHTYMNTLGELIWFADSYADGATLVCHDAKMDFMDGFGVGKAVRRFAAALGLKYRVLDTTCGLALLKWDKGISAAALQGMREEHEALQRREHPNRFRRLMGRLAR